jgi:uncharacterized membrane protein
MGDEEKIHNTRTTEGWGANSVIAVSFEQDENAYAALTQLKELDSQHRVAIQEAAVVVRDEDGEVVEKDRIESTFVPSTVGVGLLGLLIGIIGGPVGMLIGGASGLLVGSLFDLYDSEETESVLSQFSSFTRVGHTTLLAVVAEQSSEVIDATMAALGGTVLRRSVYDVEAEIAASEEAQRKAKWEAREQLLRGRREHDKEAAHTKVEKLKGKLHRGQKAASADA